MARSVRKKLSRREPGFLSKTRRIAAVADEHKASDIRAYDVRGLTVIADSFIVCSVSSEPQFKAVQNAVRENMKAIDIPPLRSEGSTRGGWLVLDYGSVILHVFREEARAYYDLDGLWGDAPQIELNLDV